MDILFYRYGSICEPDMIGAFQKLGLHVLEEASEITNKKISAAEQISLVEKVLKEKHPIFVFTINFFPTIAEICHIYRTPYLCWTVDAPVPELFSKSICHDTNRVFLFDSVQYQTYAGYNPECIYHLPLAAATERFQACIGTITDADRHKFSSDISFVGSLYSEKDPMVKLAPLPEYINGYIQGLCEASLKIYGYYPAEDALTDQVIQAIKEASPSFYTRSDALTDMDRHIVAQQYLGYHIASLERQRTLNALAEHFAVDLYTRSDTSPLSKVHVHGGVRTLDEMPKIFHLSKINLNMTIKPIQTGLPLRCFDIMGCGGFLMTNYQAELAEYFEIGTDLEAYSSIEELIDKCNYYLQHEEERKAIAANGYRKVCEQHTYLHRVTEMIRTIG